MWALPDCDGSIEADHLWKCGLCFGSCVPTSNYLPSSWFSVGPKELALLHKGSGVACKRVWRLEAWIKSFLHLASSTEEVCWIMGSFNYYFLKRMQISILSLWKFVTTLWKWSLDHIIFLWMEKTETAVNLIRKQVQVITDLMTCITPKICTKELFDMTETITETTAITAVGV